MQSSKFKINLRYSIILTTISYLCVCRCPTWYGPARCDVIINSVSIELSLWINNGVFGDALFELFISQFYFERYCNRTDFLNCSQLKTKTRNLYLDLLISKFYYISQHMDLTVVQRVKVSSLEVPTKTLLGIRLGPITRARSVHGAWTSKRRKLLISLFDWRNLQ